MSSTNTKTNRKSPEEGLASARKALLSLQKEDGHWCFPLEADCTIPSEYVMMMHFMDDVDVALERRIAQFIREKQDPAHGGWSLYFGGDFDLSCTVKSYYALKIVGDSPDAPHMARARAAILNHGGAARANVFTRLMLAMFGQIPWRGVPFVPVEIILLPKWFPFHLSKVSYWSRAVTVPLSILCSLKARAANPRNIGIRELFTVPPEEERDYFPTRTRLNRLLLMLERTGAYFEPFIPGPLRRLALRRAEQWTIERLNGECGLGAIFPAMVNANEALALLGYPYEHPYREQCRRALLGLVIEEGERAWVQPCASPVWDTVLASLSLQEDPEVDKKAVARALDWLIPNQVLDAPADWKNEHPGLAGGGWAFQYANPHYPDLDDTAAAAWALYQGDPEAYRESLVRAADWLAGMQSTNGGFAAFDSDNTYYYLNEIPFADHGALLDPPTSDVTARCAGFLALYGEPRHKQNVQRGLEFLFREQEPSGAWFGRWGTNYIYGTWSVLEGLRLVGLDNDHFAIRRAVQWLKSVQRDDGGWGESNYTYSEPEQAGRFHCSTAFQTAWAVLALMAAGEGRSHEVRRGIEYLLYEQGEDGLWDGQWFTAPGFPKVFYLKYYGYYKYFPVWALARYNAINRKISG
jgi:squalene-hopene/tetraprenyl-beta-curcumene cyclase